MDFEPVSFESDPERVVATPYDCIWLNAAGWDWSQGIENPTLQWIDWRLRGALSRALIAGGTAAPGETEEASALFLPTLGRVAAPFIAIWRGEALVPEALRRNCEGQRWQSLLYFCPAETRWRAAVNGFPSEGTLAAKCYLTKG